MTQKILFAVFLFGFFVFSPAIARAGLVISEIMYDAEGADIDWVEVYNDGGEEVDVTALKLLVSNSTSNHSINEYSGSALLGDGDYGVIVVKSKISSFEDVWGSEGNIFTASFSLPNVKEGEAASVEINSGDKDAPIDSVIYESFLGAKGDGNSLQFVSGSWESSSPSPGKENFFSLEDVTEVSDSAGEDTEEKTPSEPKVKAKIFADNIVFAGEPVDFKGAVMENSRDAEYFGKYYWNFGDGVSFMNSGQPEKIDHVFYYPGEYVVILEYSSNLLSEYEDPEYEARMIVKAVPVRVSIKPEVGEGDFGVRISNDSDYEIDISSWSLIAGRKYFTFPKRSVILPKKSLTVSSRLTGFNPGDERDLKLFSQTGKLISQYLP